MFNSDYYNTTDTALATYLLIQRFKLLNIDYSDVRYQYSFEHTNGIIDHAQKYGTGHALVDPSVYQRINRQLARVLKNKGQWLD